SLAIDEARLTVLHRQGAGCYGHNSADDAAFDAAFVAMRVPNRTVRVQWTREDEFSAAPVGAAMVVGLRAVLDAKARPAEWPIESFIDELAEMAGEDPVTYRLSLMSDLRGRRVIETAAEMADWFDASAAEGRARGLGFARYKNRAAYAAVVAEVEVDEAVRVT